jgi:phage-related protein
MWEVVYYKTANGRIPVREYIDNLNIKEAAKIDFKIKQLERLGFNLGVPYIKKVKGKIWELRIIGKNQYRILYFAATGKQLVLLHGFTKKRKKYQ